MRVAMLTINDLVYADILVIYMQPNKSGLGAGNSLQ
jgi:hypothetical protein